MPHLSRFSKNPFIQVLPPPMTARDLFIALKQIPVFEPELRLADHSVRKAELNQLISNFYQPLNMHYHLYEKVLYAITEGYYVRTPDTFLKQVGKAHKSKSPHERTVRLKNSITKGFSLFGASGLGKTTAIAKILNLLPRAHYHPEYNIIQVPYLRIDCPSDGSHKSVCTNFFEKLDEVLDTEYSKKYSYRYSAANMISQMKVLVSMYCIGLLVIDEIHNLHFVQRVGVPPLLNFFKQLSNELGVPICFIGTHEAKAVLAGNYQISRRSQGLGVLNWEGLSLDSKSKDAEKFFTTLWNLQLLRKPIPLTPELKEAYQKVSRGIISEMIMLHISVQNWAIENETEDITPKLIRKVAKIEMGLTQAILERYEHENSLELKKSVDLAETEEENKRTDVLTGIKPKSKDSPTKSSVKQAVSRQPLEIEKNTNSFFKDPKKDLEL
jgi:hypothetical protein